MKQIKGKRINIFYQLFENEITSRLQKVTEYVKEFKMISDKSFDSIFNKLKFECEKFPSLDIKNRQKPFKGKVEIPVMADENGNRSKDSGKQIDGVQYKIPILGKKDFFNYAYEGWNKDEMQAFYAYNLQDNGERYDYLNLLYEGTNDIEINEFVKNDIKLIKNNLEQLKIRAEAFNEQIKSIIQESIDKHKDVLTKNADDVKKLDQGLDDL